MPRATPYPYHRWERLEREEVEALRYALRDIAAEPFGMLFDTGQQLLGARPSIVAASARISGPGAVLKGSAELFMLEDGAGNPRLLSVDRTLAAVVVDRALGGQGDTGLGRGLAPLDGICRGILGYVIARSIASSSYRLGWPPLTAPDRAAREAEALLGQADVAQDSRGVALLFQVKLPPVTGAVHSWSALAKRPAHGRRYQIAKRVLPSFAQRLPVTLDLVAGWLELTGDELTSLEPDDVVVLDECTLKRKQGTWEGDVSLRARGAAAAHLKARLSPNCVRLHETLGCKEEHVSEGPEQTERDGEDALASVGDTPIRLQVEIARFSLPLEELTNLQPGQILNTHQSIGQRAVLRAGAQAIAVGELVEVEGEIGLRVIELAD